MSSAQTKTTPTNCCGGGGAEVSETNTENIFRDFYGSTTFIEKSAIPDSYGFKSKKNTSYKGYPDFFKEVNLGNGKRFFIIILV